MVTDVIFILTLLTITFLYNFIIELNMYNINLCAQKMIHFICPAPRFFICDYDFGHQHNINGQLFNLIFKSLYMFIF